MPSGSSAFAATVARKSGVPTRLAVYLTLIALVGCVAAEAELWPLSSFRLFSERRTGTRVEWRLVVVDAHGTESPADTAAMGRGFRQLGHQLPVLARASADERGEACAAWQSRLPQADSLRVYRRVIVQASPTAPRQLRSQELRFACPVTP